jgi:hypothetical protein
MEYQSEQEVYDYADRLGFLYKNDILLSKKYILSIKKTKGLKKEKIKSSGDVLVCSYSPNSQVYYTTTGLAIIL